MLFLPRLVAAIGGMLLLASGAFAAKQDPLSRQTPVPANEPVPLMDFIRPLLFVAPRMNEAGTHVAALAPVDAERIGVSVADLGTGKSKPLQGRETFDVLSFLWLDDQWLMFDMVREHVYRDGWYTGNVTGGNQVVQQGSSCRIAGIPVATRRHPLVWVEFNSNDLNRDGGVVQIDTIQRPRSSSNTISSDGRDTYGIEAAVLRGYPRATDGVPLRYFSDRMGELHFVIMRKDGIDSLFYLAGGGGWEKCPVDLDAIRLVGEGEKDGEILILGPRQEGKPRALQYMNARTGELGETLFQGERYDCAPGEILRQATSRQLLGVRTYEIGQRTIWANAARAQAQKMVERNFPGEVVSVLDADKAENRFLVATYSDRKPPVYHLVDLAKRSLSPVKNSGPWIDPARTQPMKLMKFPTRDGHTLDAFVTTPAGASAEHPVPLVVYPHGGPYERSSWGWDPIVQWLVSRGYAVLQPNYRGSPGYDWMFPEDDIYDHRKMHEDVNDSVKALLSTGTVDARRMAIMGEDFGGYLALCGAAFEGDRYRCAVSLGAYYDWELQMSDAKLHDLNSLRYQFWYRRLGDPKDNEAKFDAMSPLRNADKIKIPVFVSHGDTDYTVTVDHARRFDGALNSSKVPHVVRIEKEQGHVTAGFKDRMDLYTAIETFLREHLGPAN